jgi:hypothetical protein
MGEVSIPCEKCQTPLHSGDEFCASCGTAVSPAQVEALRGQLAATDVEYFWHSKQAQEATKTIGAVAVLFVIGAVIFFFMTFAQAHKALEEFAGLEASAPLATTIGGATTVGELRSTLEREPWQVLGLNLFLAAVMAGLWKWSKRAVLPAAICALGVYAAVIVGSAVVDPASIVKGVIVKIAVTVALVKSLKSAYAARRIELAR